MSLVNLARPVRSERARWFQPPWRTVFVYQCIQCGKETRVFASSFRGKRPVPSVGGVYCVHCPAAHGVAPGKLNGEGS